MNQAASASAAPVPVLAAGPANQSDCPGSQSQSQPRPHTLLEFRKSLSLFRGEYPPSGGLVDRVPSLAERDSRRPGPHHETRDCSVLRCPRISSSPPSSQLPAHLSPNPG